ncbi:M24 family metallopeptidase [Anaerosinus massiliensis]|uniref:M24 family metallopeptidase n=1 Tax=Massilibacillus massiliensis TaxID=1806837 RepID=UPI000A4C999C|nr:Xaa-Pro peptidase family protein [Massilibacillus massiliensis]
MEARLAQLRRFLEKQELDAVIIHKFENISYFSGFSGTSGIVIVTRASAKLITDFRYVEQAVKEAVLFEIVEHKKSILAQVSEEIAHESITRVGFEGDSVTYNEFSILKQHLKNIKLKAVGLDQLRSIKDSVEIKKVKKAVAISDAAFDYIVTIIKPGVSEIMIAAELEMRMRKLGSSKPAFDTIVASGHRGSLPHGLATDKILAEGELVTMDFGAVYEGYHSDITRTVCVGKANNRQREIYRIVLESQLLGVKSVKAGKSGKEVDTIVRRFIMEAGYGKFFGHGLGHGVGLAIHELPRLSPSSSSDQLEENMIVTVEPGIYIPEFGGVRIEDTVVVTSAGCDVLTSSSKQLIEINP